MKKVVFILIFLSFVTAFCAKLVHAQSGQVFADKTEIVKARVLEIIDQGSKTVPGTDVKSSVQTIKVEIRDGSERGKIIRVENDYLNLKQGETFYLKHTTEGQSGAEFYSVEEPYRLPKVLALVGLFILVVVLFGGLQGLRGLLSLCGSFLLIVYVLLPGVLHGYPPLLIATGVSSLIIIVGSYITHGFNKTTTSAVVGMILTVVITGLLAYFAVHWTRLSGYGTEETAYLNINTRGSLDLVGLLLGGIMIGLLGVLYDAAIGQAISVEELSEIAPHVPRKKIYERAIRIGREHIGALVNTLAIAYVGASLPLLLLFYMSPTGTLATTANREIFATEIVRTMIGSIGLVLAIPITTLVSIWLLMGRKKSADRKVVAEEEHALEHAGHSHSH
jgi:uncharacterized membrane protein